MKLPSLTYLFSNAKISFLRFPLTLISAILATVLGIYLVEEHDNISNFFPYINFMLCLALGIPLYFCVATSSERHGFSKTTLWVLNALATVILVLIYFSLPDSDSTHNTRQPYIRYGIYNATIHLFVSFLPFISSKSLNGYWQFNKALFVRIWTSALYSGVLYLGLVLALGALHLLFDIHIHDELYFELFIVISGIINTWFFLTGIPSDLSQLDELEHYPKGLKVFSQYILLPLLALYLLILYVYGAKIIALWHWPKGIVSNLTISISVLGILTFLLLHPYGKISGNGWIRIASRAYYFLLIPLLVILFIAISMRLGEYGLTVSRYAIIVLGIWLSVLCLYTAVGKSNIKFIPASLAFMLLLISFGPWSVFSASESAQVGRLKTILENADILKNGRVVNETSLINEKKQITLDEKLTNEGRLNDSLHNEVYSIFQYLDDFHGFGSVRNWFHQNVDSIHSALEKDKEKKYWLDERDVYMRALGLKPERIYTEFSGKYVEYSAIPNDMISVSGYDYIKDFDHYEYNQDTLLTTVMLDSVLYSFYYTFKSGASIRIVHNGETSVWDVSSLLKKLKEQRREKQVGQTSDSIVQEGLPSSAMQSTVSVGNFDFKAEFNYISVERDPDSSKVGTLNGRLFIRRNQAANTTK